MMRKLYLLSILIVLFCSCGKDQGEEEKPEIAVTSITLSQPSVDIIEGEIIQLTVTILPSNASDKTVIWKSSNVTVASVDENGHVKAMKVGQAIITAKAGNKTAECTVTVSPKRIDVTMLLLNKTELSMIVGEEYPLVATIVPENATERTIQWSTSAPEIATVDNGKVTAVKEGFAKIVAYVDGKTAECSVTIDYIPVQSITLAPSDLTLYEGEEHTLSATITPENATYQSVLWSTTDDKIANVENGKVVAIKKGSAKIKGEANGKTAECQVEVLSSVANISLDKNELGMKVGDTQTLNAVITPEDATLRESLVWASSDENVVIVDQSGKVDAIKEGTATVSVSVEGKKAECVITVDYVHVSSIDLSQTEATLFIGDALTLTATLNPSNVTYNTIEWTSSDENVVVVSGNGQVSAVGKGSAIVSAKSDGKEASCSFTVLVPLTGLSFDQNSLTLSNGNTTTLSVVKTPADASIKGEIVWNSSNPSVATVSQEGVISAINKGTTDITATADGFTATCTINVIIPVNSVSLNKTELSLAEGYSETITATVLPDDASDKTVTWTSSDQSVATVEDGKICAIKEGETTITARAGEIAATCKVTVTKKIDVAMIMLDNTQLSMNWCDEKKLTATIVPANATEQNIQWSTSNPNVATVENGLISAVWEGSTTIVAYIDGKTAQCAVEIYVSFPEYVDLGLSVKWATRNLGASLPPDYGDYYAWGEIETKGNYSDETYKWGSWSNVTKYNNDSYYGIVDNKTVLEAEDDVAHVKLGGNWRMPTKSEFDELITTRNNSNYKWEWKQINGHNGWMIKYLVNGQSIFLPATGEWYHTSLLWVGTDGIYWSSSLHTGGAAWNAVFGSEGSHTTSRGRCFGESVRPVLDN
ncbi:MAG: Ig domain-containing protein [Bacteroidales bacterium]|nr:Ig domain-containing protein [Bacteroidales bacterium]